MINQEHFENKIFAAKIDDWNNFNSCACNIEDAITTLAEKKRDFSWAISDLVSDLVLTVEARTRALDDLKPYGVESVEDAMYCLSKIKK